MDKYSSFEIFMIEVVNKANSISDLNELFDVKYDALISTILNIIKTCGWWVFIALCTLLALGPFAFGITMLQYFNTFFKLDGNELYLESDGRKYIVDLDNSTEEPKAPSTGLGILKWFLIIVAILVVIFIIFKCIMKRKKVTKKLIEDQIYQTFE